MKRKLSLRNYVLALVLTVLVFSGGILLGIFIDRLRLNDAAQTTLNEKVNLRSLQLQQNYLDSGQADCKALNRVLEANIDELAKKMAVVIDYEKRSVFNENEFKLQLQDYFLTEIQFLLVSQEIDQKCSKDNIKIIYFYDDNPFDTQGDILDYLKKVFGSRVLVFSLDSTFTQEPMINILLTSYNIKQFPAVIVDGQVFQGHTSVEVLMDALCAKFLEMDKQLPAECPAQQKISSEENILFQNYDAPPEN